MKRGTAAPLAVSLILVAVVTATSAHAQSYIPAGSPGADAGFMQMADAVWIVPENRTQGTFYFAGALRVTPTINGMETWGYVGKGECFTSRDGHGSLTVCSGVGRGHRLDPMDFELDPLLADARMTLETKNFTHEISWTGTGETPDQSVGAQTSGQSVQAMAAMSRSAKAEGEVFGLRLARGPRFSWLFQGVIAYAQLNTFGYEFLDDGRVRLTRTYRH